MKTETKLSKLEKILNLAKQKGASEAEVIQKAYTENPVSFENNKLKTLESNQNSGIAVRLIKNKKIGIASSTDPEALESIVDSAIEASEFGPDATFELSKEKLDEKIADRNTPELPLEELVDKGTQVIETLKPFHKDLLISGGFDLRQSKTIYLNSNSVYGQRVKNVYSTGFYAHLVRGEDFLGVYEGNSSLEVFPDEKEISSKILKKLNYSRENISLDTKKYPVIFTPNAVLSIFGHILSVTLNGKAVQQGISSLSDKLGKEVFDKKLTFTEDPTTGTQKTPFDDEGIKTTKKVLVKEGTVNSFYFDLSSASKMKQKTTGNGFKGSLSILPSPSLTSLLIENGKVSYSDLIKHIKEGILVDQLLGAGQSNTLAGEYNVGIELGFKIENGEIKGRIKNCMIGGNIFETLKNISEISHDREWVNGSCYFPYFYIENMTVAGK